MKKKLELDDKENRSKALPLLSTNKHHKRAVCSSLLLIMSRHDIAMYNMYLLITVTCAYYCDIWTHTTPRTDNLTMCIDVIESKP